MNSIAFNIENEKLFSSRIQKFFKQYQIGSMLKKSNAYKEQGFSAVALVQYLFGIAKLAASIPFSKTL